MKPHRIIHPSHILFLELAARMAEKIHPGDEDRAINLEGEIKAFLCGGELTESCAMAIASYLETDPQTWRNMWANYLEHNPS
jgi:plasmid maintenance system antidote protein VapI